MSAERITVPRSHYDSLHMSISLHKARADRAEAKLSKAIAALEAMTNIIAKTWLDDENVTKLKEPTS